MGEFDETWWKGHPNASLRGERRGLSAGRQGTLEIQSGGMAVGVVIPGHDLGVCMAQFRPSERTESVSGKVIGLDHAGPGFVRVDDALVTFPSLLCVQCESSAPSFRGARRLRLPDSSLSVKWWPSFLVGPLSRSYREHNDV